MKLRLKKGTLMWGKSVRKLRKAGRRVLEAVGHSGGGKPVQRTYPPDFSREDIETIEAVAPYTTTSVERIYALLRAVEYIVHAKIPGAIVECGVWKGGSMMAVSRTLQRLGDTSRHLYLFDTFMGMTPPDGIDRTYCGEPAASLLEEQDRDTSWVWAKAPLEGVKEAMGGTGYPGEISYIKGRVEETIPGAAPDVIALLRLDTDWYKSTYHELLHLFPRLSPGGVLLIDDYGHWEGARRAVDQYLAETGIALLLHRIDYSGRIATKL